MTDTSVGVNLAIDHLPGGGRFVFGGAPGNVLEVEVWCQGRCITGWLIVDCLSWNNTVSLKSVGASRGYNRDYCP